MSLSLWSAQGYLELEQHQEEVVDEVRDQRADLHRGGLRHDQVAAGEAQSDAG